MRPPEVCVGTQAALLQRLSDDFVVEATGAVARRGFFAVALSGGSVAVEAFPVLAGVGLDWDRVHFFWVDERAVSPSDPDSNYAMARARWLAAAKVPIASIHRMPADDTDLDAAAVCYADELTRVLGMEARLDYVLLGVGPDGHVASLFRGHADTSEAGTMVIPVLDAPKPPARRLTLSMSMLTRAQRVVVMAFGESKAEVIGEAIKAQDSPLPVAQLLRRTTRALVLLDAGAASRIP